MTMTLIGQYDSPFVRRVGIALTLYHLPFRQEPWSVFADADRIRAHSPLTRVPVLVLEDGESLIDSHMILDHLDSLVPPAQALFPRAGAARRRALRTAALAAGLGDKAVALFFELQLHKNPSEVFVHRCRAQIADSLAALEADLAGQSGAFWNGSAPGHADIAVACVWRHATDAHPGLVDPAVYPTLARLCDRLEALPVFRSIAQPFVAPV